MTIFETDFCDIFSRSEDLDNSCNHIIGDLNDIADNGEFAQMQYLVDLAHSKYTPDMQQEQIDSYKMFTIISAKILDLNLCNN